MKISPLQQRKKHSKSFAEKRTMTSNDTTIQTTMTKIFCSIFLVCFTLGRFLTTKKEKKNATSEEDGSESIVLVAFVVLVVSVPNKPFKESGGEVYIHRFLVLDNLHRDNNFA